MLRPRSPRPQGAEDHGLDPALARIGTPRPQWAQDHGLHPALARALLEEFPLGGVAHQEREVTEYRGNRVPTPLPPPIRLRPEEYGLTHLNQLFQGDAVQRFDVRGDLNHFQYQTDDARQFSGFVAPPKHYKSSAPPDLQSREGDPQTTVISKNKGTECVNTEDSWSSSAGPSARANDMNRMGPPADGNNRGKNRTKQPVRGQPSRFDDVLQPSGGGTEITADFGHCHR